MNCLLVCGEDWRQSINTTGKLHLDSWVLSMTFLYFQAISRDYCNVECLILHLVNNVGIV